jgi:uncharacterized membrane protein
MMNRSRALALLGLQSLAACEGLIGANFDAARPRTDAPRAGGANEGPGGAGGAQAGQFEPPPCDERALCDGGAGGLSEGGTNSDPSSGGDGASHAGMGAAPAGGHAGNRADAGGDAGVEQAGDGNLGGAGGSAGAPCMPNPCRYGGHCTSEGLTATCTCRTGFGGAHCETPHIVAFDFPRGTTSSCATAMSADGSVIVGNYQQNNWERVFRWTATDGVQELPLIDGTTRSMIWSVSGSGELTAGSIVSGNGYDAAVWGAADAPKLPLIGLGNSYGNAISGDGRVVACTLLWNDPPLPCVYDMETGLHVLDPVAECGVQFLNRDGSVATGNCPHADSRVATRWTIRDGSAEMEAIAPAPSVGWAINADGSVLGGWLESPVRPFRWTAETGAVEIGLPDGAVEGSVKASSEDGNVLLGDSFPNGAFIWTPASGSIELARLLESAGTDSAGWSLKWGWALSADGHIASGCGQRGGSQIAWVAGVP